MFAALALLGGALAQQPSVELHRALSYRHALPCAEIEALTDDPVADLLAAVEQIEQPPWAPMRAAQCLVASHATTIRADLERWVVVPEQKGLGLLALGMLDQMPVETAVPVARLALRDGPDREAARLRVGRSTVPEVRALVEEAR